jgi:hypothetical protein
LVTPSMFGHFISTPVSNLGCTSLHECFEAPSLLSVLCTNPVLGYRTEPIFGQVIVFGAEGQSREPCILEMIEDHYTNRIMG